MIKSISIQNFRGIKELKDVELKNLTLLIGENGTSKTSILEAINFCLSPYFLQGRIKHTDFYNGEDVEIKISLEFSDSFKVYLPDGYNKQEIECDKICLRIKRREKGAPNKAFSDIVVISHCALPNRGKDNEKGWEITRKNGSIFRFDERQLTFPLETEGLIRSFYFPKNRERQLYKGFNSSISSVFDDFNWRFSKEIKKIETAEDFEGKTFYTHKSNFEESILEKIDEKSQEKTFKKLNTKLGIMGLPAVNFSFIDIGAPFDSAFLSQKLDSLDLPVSQLGSGIEMIISFLFLETMAEISKENILILVDEPELHLHPHLQNNFINHLIPILDDNQFLLSTHSPLFVKQTLNNIDDKIQLHCLEKENEEVEISELENKVLPYASANEINFIAFNLATEEYHNELYNELQTNFWNEPSNNFKTLKEEGAYSSGVQRQEVFDNEFFSKQKHEEIDCPFRGNENKVTAHTYIRNKIHHPKENGGSPKPEELEESIKKLRTFFI